jgi:molybdopterin synthase catalytic subunit
MSVRFRVSAQPLDELAVSQSVSAPDAGAVVTFVGRVRDNARGHAVAALEYEAYAEMAESMFAQIARQAAADYAIKDVAVHHRTGRLEVGDVSVIVAVSAAHRAAAFDACHAIIDALKQSAPIWKKEYSPEGAVWIDDGRN